MKPMENPLGVSPSKGNRETTRGKEKIIFDLGGNRRTHDLRIRSAAMCPHFLFAAMVKRPRLSLSDLVAQSAEQRET